MPNTKTPAPVTPISPAVAKAKSAKDRKTNILFRLLALLVTVVLVIGAAALVVFRDRLNVDALRRWISYRSITTDVDGQAEPFPHAGGDKLSLAYLNSGIVLSSATGARYYSFTGDQYAEEVLNMTNPTMTSCGSAAVVFDAGSSSLFLFRNGEEATEFADVGTGSILSARVNESGWLTVTAQQTGYKGAVTVFNAAGDAVIQISLSSTFVVDAALSPDCRSIAVITIDQKGGVFGSHLTFYSVSSTEPGVAVDLGNTTVLDLDYESGQIWVLGEDQLMSITPDGETFNRWSFGRDYLKGCDLSPDGFALVLLGGYRLGSADRAVTIGATGEELGSLSLREQILSYAGAGNYCSLLSGSALTIYDRALTPYAGTQDTNGARYTALAKDGSALLADDQRAWLYIPG